MRIGARITLCVILMAAAASMAVLALADLVPAEASVPGYVLGEAEGRVAVYGGGADKLLTVTDIELAGLREADQALISEGLPVSTHEELVALLEDLGS